MEKRMKIVFGKPEYLPTRSDGIEIYYPYQIINIKNKKGGIEEIECEKFGIEVSISSSLATTFGFQIWQPADYYKKLMSILLPYAINAIKNKHKNTSSNKIEEYELLNLNYIDERIHRIDILRDVEGYEESI